MRSTVACDRDASPAALAALRDALLPKLDLRRAAARQRLLPKLLSGEIRRRDAERIVDAAT